MLKHSDINWSERFGTKTHTYMSLL